MPGELLPAGRTCGDCGHAVFWPVPNHETRGSTDIEWSCDADARLIAAAPEMYELLERARSYLLEHASDDEGSRIHGEMTGLLDRIDGGGDHG